MVKVMCYKSEGRWFDPKWCHWNLSLTLNPSVRTMTMGSTQPLTEISTRSISAWDKGGRYVRLTILPPSCAVVMKSGNLNSWNPLDHSRPVLGLIYLYVRVYIQLLCVPNRPCCFRNFGIQRHFVRSIEQQQWRTQEFCSGGVQQIHLRTENRSLPLPLYFTKNDVIRVLCFFRPGRKLW